MVWTIDKQNTLFIAIDDSFLANQRTVDFRSRDVSNRTQYLSFENTAEENSQKSILLFKIIQCELAYRKFDVDR